MKNVLIIYGHPYPQMSNANKRILERVGDKLPQAEIITLAELYPDGSFDVEREQARLTKADVIVFEYPLFWYSTPWILQKYFEDVLAYGFAYGSTGDKLKGKTLIASFTCGAQPKNYEPGVSGETLADLQKPMEATCWLCGMNYAGAVITTGAMYFGLDDKQVEELNTRVDDHADSLVNLIKSI